tara:strand:- start:35 stop:1156 length:1122 start_codon:yes stop_codon:yes gene_type:complete
MDEKMNTPGDKKLKIGSLFAGIGGFELGIERAIPNAETVWQVEQNKYCQGILKKHWPNATIYDDVRNITQHNVEPVDILIGGFPCQSISVAGKQRGLEDEKKSGLWWEFHRIISELRPRIVVMENVANVLRLGGLDVVGSLAEIGYDAEWTIISAKQFGAPHLRKRWFCVAYPNTRREKSTVQTRRQESSCRLATNSNGSRPQKQPIRTEPTQWKTPQMLKHGNRPNVYATDTNSRPDRERREDEQSYPTSEGRETTVHQANSKRKKSRWKKNIRNQRRDNTSNITTDTDDKRFEKRIYSIPIQKRKQHAQGSTQDTRRTYWQKITPESPLCNVDDGISKRVARLKALGNAIVPQCSQYIGECIVRSGLLDEI